MKKNHTYGLDLSDKDAYLVQSEIISQAKAIANFLLFQPFTFLSNKKKSKQIYDDLIEQRESFLRSIGNKQISIKKIYQNIVNDHKKLFDDASAWMKKSNNDHILAAELFRKNNQTQEKLTASAAETPSGWIP